MRHRPSLKLGGESFFIKPPGLPLDCGRPDQATEKLLRARKNASKIVNTVELEGTVGVCVPLDVIQPAAGPACADRIAGGNY